MNGTYAALRERPDRGLLYFSGYLSSPTHSRGDLALAAIVGIYPMTFLSVFFNVALAGAAAASFDGRPIGVREALGISWKRLGRIAQWSLLAAGAGLLLEQIASRIPGAGRLASWLLGAAWSLATIFAVPLLALEGAGPLETAKHRPQGGVFASTEPYRLRNRRRTT